MLTILRDPAPSGDENTSEQGFSGLKSSIVFDVSVEAVASNQKLYIVPHRSAFAFGLARKSWVAQLMLFPLVVIVHGVLA